MSYEYRLVFDDEFLMQRVIDSLKSSDAYIKSQEQEICLKDRLLQSAAEYDARLILESNFSMWLEVNFRSMKLYDLVRNALHGEAVRCYEDGDLDCEVSLKGAFRIKDEC
ncbi:MULTISPECIES: hypothetical protein [unclassified Variovorax]|uniref:hypothetical protein n=1 Tax=unclassified Variovorax TaxID=663243 RepID=UPI003F44D07D